MVAVVEGGGGTKHTWQARWQQREHGRVQGS